MKSLLSIIAFTIICCVTVTADAALQIEDATGQESPPVVSPSAQLVQPPADGSSAEQAGNAIPPACCQPCQNRVVHSFGIAWRAFRQGSFKQIRDTEFLCPFT